MENNGNTIDSIVNDLGNMPGAIIVIAAMNNGLKLGESVRHDDLGNKVAAMLATALGSGKEVMGMLGQEESIRGVFYTNDALLMIVPAGNKALLALLISNGFHEESMPMVSLKLAADKIAAIIK